MLIYSKTKVYSMDFEEYLTVSYGKFIWREKYSEFALRRAIGVFYTYGGLGKVVQ